MGVSQFRIVVDKNKIIKNKIYTKEEIENTFPEYDQVVNIEPIWRDDMDEPEWLVFNTFEGKRYYLRHGEEELEDADENKVGKKVVLVKVKTESAGWMMY